MHCRSSSYTTFLLPPVFASYLTLTVASHFFVSDCSQSWVKCLRRRLVQQFVFSKKIVLPPPPPAPFGFHPPSAPHIRPNRPFCVSTHFVLRHVCKIEWVRRESGSQVKGWFHTEQGRKGGRTDTYVDTGQAGRLVADQQLPLPPSNPHTPTSVTLHLNKFDPPSVFSHSSISFRENIGRM